jgi:glycosyltransferase involved in cell wall biosynthesis
MPTKVLEYITMGLPVISSRVKAVEDLFDDSAILFFEPGNAEQFARCALELFDNPARREELVRNADLRMAGIDSWGDECRTYLNLLNRLLVPGGQIVVPEEGSVSEIT